MKTYCAVFSLMIFFFHCGEHQQIPEQPQEKAIETFDCGKLPGKEKSIRYQIARRTRTNDGVLLLNISTDKKNLEHDNLIALACRLRSDTATESRVFVQIFDSRRSAERYVPHGRTRNLRTRKKHLRVASHLPSRFSEARALGCVVLWPSTSTRNFRCPRIQTLRELGNSGRNSGNSGTDGTFSMSLS